jgi:hypothetical protein
VAKKDLAIEEEKDGGEKAEKN